MTSLAIVFAIDDGYARPLSVALYSLLKHQGAQTHYDFYVIYQALSEESQQLLSAVVDQHAQRATLNLIKAKEEDLQRIPDFNQIPHGGGWGKTPNLRLLLASYLPHLDRVLYLDADTLVLQDLSHLSQLEMQNKGVAGVADVVYLHKPFATATLRVVRIAQFLGDDLDHFLNHQMQGLAYVNSGVLLLNLSYWREHHWQEQFLALLQKLVDEHQRLSYSKADQTQGAKLDLDFHLHPDQDVINYLAMRDSALLMLPFGYNCPNSFFDLGDTLSPTLTQRSLTTYQYTAMQQCISRQQLATSSDQVFIVHFLEGKPWREKDQAIKEHYHAYAKAAGWQIELPNLFNEGTPWPIRLLKALVPYGLMMHYKRKQGYRLRKVY